MNNYGLIYKKKYKNIKWDAVITTQKINNAI